ncbi:MAG: hypothetical protein HY509_02485 [Acidobacteria bacterium]|nr:hypothetical protein [Acidobacteriota bacterium]
MNRTAAVGRRRAARLAVRALLALGLWLLAPAVRSEPEAPGLETRVFQIHFKEVSDIFLLIEDQVGETGAIWMQPKLKTISVTDTPENLDRIARLIAEYDLPPRNIEVTFRLILASTRATEGQVEPPRVRDIIRKIDEVTTRWGNYRLLGSATVIGTEGERSELMVGEEYRIGFWIEYAGERQGVVTVRLADFSLERLQEDPEKKPGFVPLLTTSLNLKRDQLYILGTSKSESHDRALFVAISASTL